MTESSRASSNPSDLVLDCFIGSGTTAAVAQKLGRRWIACDINKGAIQTTAKRLMAVIRDQLAAAEKASGSQTRLASANPKPRPSTFNFPPSTAFAVYRVNDYDLQIQHNEAVELACEHIGVTRNRSDAFFDGTLGKRLVKIVPFGHPVTPLDLEEVKRELAARPDEDRDVVVVCLGKELATEPGWKNGTVCASAATCPTRLKSSNCAPTPSTAASSRTNPQMPE